jgi:site-specific recombinase XerD
MELATADHFDALARLVTDGLSSQHSVRAYRRAISEFTSWFYQASGRRFDKETVQAYRAYLMAQGLAPASVNLKLAAVRQLAAEAADNQRMDPGLAAGIGRAKGVKADKLPSGRRLADGEVRALFLCCAEDPTAAGARDAALLALLRLGLRRAEAAALQVGDYDPEAGELRVSGKGRKERLVPAINGAAAYLADWLALRGPRPGPLLLAVRRGGHIDLRQGISGNAIAQILAKRAAAAGVRPFSAHDWRRTCASDLLEAGEDLAVVADWLGHESTETTRRYDLRGEQAKRAAAGALHVPYYGKRAPAVI